VFSYSYPAPSRRRPSLRTTSIKPSPSSSDSGRVIHKVRAALKANDLTTSWSVLDAANMGNREMQRRGVKTSADTEWREPLHVMDDVRAAGALLPGDSRATREAEAVEMYDYLCEFCHPNMGAFMQPIPCTSKVCRPYRPPGPHHPTHTSTASTVSPDVLRSVAVRTAVSNTMGTAHTGIRPPSCFASIAHISHARGISRERQTRHDGFTRVGVAHALDLSPPWRGPESPGAKHGTSNTSASRTSSRTKRKRVRPATAAPRRDAPSTSVRAVTGRDHAPATA